MMRSPCAAIRSECGRDREVAWGEILGEKGLFYGVLRG